MIDLMKFKFRIGLLHALMHAGGRVQGKAVQRQHVLKRQEVRRGQAVDVAQNEATGVADAPVGVHQSAQDLIRNADILAVLYRGNPEAHDFGPEFFNKFLRSNHVAHGF